MTEAELTNGRISYKDIWTVAFPIVVGGLAENINNVVNTAFVGHLGETAIGAVGMGGMYYFNFVVLVLGLSAGAQIIIGRRNGEQNYQSAGNVFTHAFLLFMIISVGLTAILHFATPKLLSILISSPKIYLQAADYAGIRIFGFVFIAAAICFRAFFIGITRTRIIIIITLISASTNIILDYIFIFGRFGFPVMGIRGAAYASIIAEGVSMTGYILAIFLLPYVKKYKLFSFKEISFGITGNILKVGSPLMLQNWISFSAWLVFFIFIEKMGERDLAVSSIIKSIYLLFLIPMWGFASATNTLTSNLIGQGRANEVINLLKKISIITLGIMIVMVQANFLFPREILSIFSKDAGLVEAAVGPLWVVSAALIFYAGSVVLFNGVSGAGDTRTALIIEIITIILYFIYIYVLTRVFQMNMMIVWTSEIVYMMMLGVLSFIRLRSGKWKRAAV